MRGLHIFAALVGLCAGACLCDGLIIFALQRNYTVRSQQMVVPAATQMDVRVLPDEVVLVHESESGTLRVHYTKVEQTSP